MNFDFCFVFFTLLKSCAQKNCAQKIKYMWDFDFKTDDCLQKEHTSIFNCSY